MQAMAVIENSPTDMDFSSVYDLAPKDEARAAVVTWQALQSARAEADAGHRHLASPAAQQPYVELQHAAATAHAELREKLQDPDRAAQAGDNIQAGARKNAAHKALVRFLAAVLQRMTSTAALPAKEFLAQLPPLVSGLANTVLVMRDALIMRFRYGSRGNASWRHLSRMQSRAVCPFVMVDIVVAIYYKVPGRWLLASMPLCCPSLWASGSMSLCQEYCR